MEDDRWEHGADSGKQVLAKCQRLYLLKCREGSVLMCIDAMKRND